MTSPPQPGAVLKALRIQRGWTLNEVSSKTGIAASTLSKVENAKMSLTYDKLLRLSEGLDVDIAQLLGSPAPGDAAPAPLTGRRTITRHGEGSEIDTPNYDHWYLAADLLNKQIVPIIADAKARTLAEFGELIRHSGEEYALIIEGSVEFNSELYTPVLLHQGDSIYFDSSMGHAYLAAAPGRCRVLSICSSIAAVGAAPTPPELRVVRGG
ncbi:helix-turn-helix domain-containing protein [Glacieibacterium sp.]|uniref:helix-turn-helix domain-containing protein n=1 Tax=Glacieibacterium sp. TaxID=2860237 RepID=UPI003AFFFB3D